MRGLDGLVRMAQRELGFVKKAIPASVGTVPLLVRCSRRVLSSLSSRLICWLSADCTIFSSMAARLMEPSSTTRTK